MPQSNIIFGFLFAAFVIYITQRGELPIYLGFLLASPNPASGSSSNSVNVSQAVQAATSLAAG